MGEFLKAIDKKIQGLKDLNQRKDDYVLGILMDNKHIIIDMNTEDQLYIKGVDSDNVPLIKDNPYSPYTVNIKRQKGQPTNRVTLKDEGDFHGSFTVKKTGNKLNISSDDNKTFDLTMRYGDAIFGLIEENIEELRVYYVKPEILKRLKAL